MWHRVGRVVVGGGPPVGSYQRTYTTGPNASTDICLHTYMYIYEFMKEGTGGLPRWGGSTGGPRARGYAPGRPCSRQSVVVGREGGSVLLDRGWCRWIVAGARRYPDGPGWAYMHSSCDITCMDMLYTHIRTSSTEPRSPCHSTSMPTWLNAFSTNSRTYFGFVLVSDICIV